VAGAQVAQRDLSARDHATKRSFCELFQAVIYGRLNQWTPTQVPRLACEDLNACGACGANGEVWEHSKHCVISGLKECIQTLRTTLSARRLAICTLSLSIRS
jgi:hypothetical protein